MGPPGAPRRSRAEAGGDAVPLRARPGRFFALAFGLSWLFWLPAAAFGGDVLASRWGLLLAAGGLGPALAELVLLYRESSRAAWRDYRARVLDPRRIGGRWWAVVLGLPPLVTVLAAALHVAAGGDPPELGEAARLLASPAALAAFALFVLLFGPLPEELGWRGYALDGLQQRTSALAASLVLGVAWAAWHLPLFFMEGTFQERLGLGSPEFWWFMVSILAQSVLFTWIYNNTRRSTLSAILFHFMINFTGELAPLPAEARMIQLGLWLALAAGVTAAFGPARLRRVPAATTGGAGPPGAPRGPRSPAR